MEDLPNEGKGVGRAKSFQRTHAARTGPPLQPVGVNVPGPSGDALSPKQRAEDVTDGLAGIDLIAYAMTLAEPGFGPPLADEAAAETMSQSSRSSVTSVCSMATHTTGPPIGFDIDRKTGKKGRLIEVVTNFVMMEGRNAHRIQQYRVDFTPVEDLTFIKKQLMMGFEKTLGRFIFDGAMLYTSKPIADENLTLTTRSDKHGRTYNVLLRFVGEIDSDNPNYIQFYNTVFRKCLSLMELDELGRNYFDSHKVIEIEGAPLQLWPGYITAIKRHDAGLLLCIEATHKVLRTTSVYEMIMEIVAKNRDLEAARAEVRKQVIGQIVITHYNKKTYRIDGIEFGSNPTVTFNSNLTGQNCEMSYIDYYRLRYNIEIAPEHHQQPMLVSQPRKKDINKGMRTNIYLVPTLCNMTGLSDHQRKDFRLMQKMSDCLHMDPQARRTKIVEFVTRLKETPLVVNECASWNVELNPEFLKARARGLAAEEIHLQTRTNDDILIMPDGLADWTNLLKRHYMLDRKQLTDWILYMHVDQRTKSSKLIQAMREQARLLGMSVEDPLCVAPYFGRGNLVSPEDLERPLSQHGKRLKFVVFVLPNNQLQRYVQVKKFFVLEHGIAVQCLIERNIENKNFFSIMSKMMIQINSKLGGIPWSVKIPFKTKVMILGYDVYHCSERKNESVGALVGTIAPTLGKYFSVVSFHKDKSELANNMCLDTKKCLEAFRLANAVLPDRIFLYRDGVGEGQLPFVLDHEVRRMEAGIFELYNAANLPLPKFSFIVVTKKINNRFMTMNSMGRACNPAPGTVLDKVMTIPGRFDFFLVSQSVRQGTVSPTSYNVIADNSGLSADSIQQLSYKLCHLYFNWSGTVAVPAPCQFAHKLAYLTGIALCRPAPANLHSVLWYL